MDKKKIMMIAYLTLCVTYGVMFYNKYTTTKKS